MFALLSPQLWIGLALAAAMAFTHGLAYRSGKANVRAAWDAEKVVQQQALADANAAARAKEQALQRTKDEAINAATKRTHQAVAAAAAARAVTDSLRDDLSRARADIASASLDAVRKYATTASAVLGECSAEVERLAGAAAGHASDSLMYQQAWPKP